MVRNTPEILESADAQAEAAKCAVALIGLPDDTGVVMNHGRAGARSGPAAFRAALSRYGVASPSDERRDAHAYPRVFDAGDVVPGDGLTETHDRVTEVTAFLIRRGFFPIAIGGGHDLTFAFVRGVASVHGRLEGVYFDAHLDVRPEPGSGMPFRALLKGGHAGRLTVVGLNPMANTREHMEYFTSHGGRAAELAQAPTQYAAPDRRLFASLDMDVFDAAFAPGVSAPNPCGLTPRDLAPHMLALGRDPMVRCFDIMELNPAHDSDASLGVGAGGNADGQDGSGVRWGGGGRTARLAAHMFLSFLRGFAERPANVPSAGRTP